MVELIKMTTIGYVSSKAMKVFNKDYGDIMMFITILYAGISICTKISGWYNGIMDTEFMKFMTWLF